MQPIRVSVFSNNALFEKGMSHLHQDLVCIRSVFRYVVAVSVLGFGLILSATASVSASAWVATDYVEGRLLSSTQGTGSSRELLAAIDLKLKPKWKTYWRTPGDAGLPPELDWSGSKNFDEVTLLYPAPIRFQLFGLQTFGYEKRVVFPLKIKLKTIGEPVDLKLKLNVLVCSDVCVPQVLALALQVPRGPPVPSADSHLIQRAIARVPVDGAAAGLLVHKVAAISTDDEQGIKVDVASETPLGDFDVIPEVTPFLAFSAPEITRSVDQKSAQVVFTLAQSLPAGETLAGRAFSVLVTHGAEASETKITSVDEGSAQSTRWLSTLAIMLGAALLGGLLLNLMPCVLPVLSVKLLSLVKAKEKTPRNVRTQFLATAAGILFALLALAVILVTVKSAGLAVGWGIQFQQPVFIGAMAVIITLFACNLWGFYEVALPSSLTNWAGSQGVGETSHISHFLTGIFVTILATPCSAPFLGTAVGFALASGPGQTLAIFAALGLGLALPYIAIAIRPSMIRFLPSPGPWMLWLRQILGVALLATAIWLLTVLASQVGWSLAGLAAVGLAALIAVLGLWRLKPQSFSPTAVVALVTLLSTASIALPNLLSSNQVSGASEEAGPIVWQAFDENQIRSLIAQGQTVFVDVTADWCITCKANKRLVINQDDVASRLNEDVVAMRADWTSPDPKITSFLARFGRYGIPMNVVFGPGRPQGIVLPEILTSDRVLEALDRVRRHSAETSG